MSKSDKEIIYVCKGPVIGTLSKEDVERLKLPKNAVGHVKRGVETKKTIKPGKIATDPKDSVKPKTETVIENCGQRLNELIEQVPFDGLDYEITCPKCGNVMTVMRTPIENEGESNGASGG